MHFEIIKKVTRLWKKSDDILSPLPSSKIKLADNKRLTDSEFDRINKICDIFTAISDTAGHEIIAPPAGGVFWEKAHHGMGPFNLYLRKNRNEIEHLFLLFNAFRDFCALAYEYEEYTPAPDFWIRRYMRLAQAMPYHWRVHMPARFGELGWNIEGFPVNRWTSINQERINVIALAGITKYLEMQRSPRILEIGAGAGEMGYALCTALPNCTWFDCDLLGCLIYSAIYLTTTLPHKKHYIYVGNQKLPTSLDETLIIRDAETAAKCKNAVIYIPHFLLNDFVGHLHLHFAYNTYSFGEMPKQAVTHYAHLLSHFLKKHGALYEQNGYFPERGGDDPESILATLFNQHYLPPPFDGKMLPNGPVRFWYNNAMGKTIQNYITKNKFAKIIESFNDDKDMVDIEYPNKILWPKVYELFSSPQQVETLYPW